MTPSEPGMQRNEDGTSRDSKRGRGRPLVRGLVTLKRAVRELGGRVIDGRTSVGKQLAAWRANLVCDLGGDISTQQAAIVELAVRTKLILDSIDAWLLTQRTLVLARRKSLLPAVRERMQLSDALARYLGQLGLERRKQDVPDLASYLAKRRDSDQGVRSPESASRSDRPPRRYRNELGAMPRRVATPAIRSVALLEALLAERIVAHSSIRNGHGG